MRGGSSDDLWYAFALDRRAVLQGLAAAAALVAAGGTAAAGPIRSRCRVIIDNDYAGDPDGLFQLAHHVLSESVDIRLIVPSHLAAKDPFDASTEQPGHGAANARALLRTLGMDGRHPIVPGSAVAMPAMGSAARSDATDAIIAEAMRQDPTPLYYAAGGGLTEIASAWLKEPRIARRLVLVWIGGMEYDRSSPQSQAEPEYNSKIDLAAARTIFNQSDLTIWQVPRNAYRQMLVSRSELQRELASCGALGKLLLASIARVDAMMAAAPPPYDRGLGETYILGDSPLVTLTALQSAFEPDASSSSYEIKPMPTLDDRGFYGAARAGRRIRVYRTLDTRLTFADMFAKFRDGAASGA